MLLLDEIRPCDACGEETVHQRHRLRGLRIASLVIAAPGLALLPSAGAIFFLGLGLVLFLVDLGRALTFISCGRCRSRAMARRTQTQPTFQESTIDFI